MSEIQTVAVENIYDYYPLYQIIYSRERRYKQSEARAANFVMKQLMEWNTKSGLIDFSRTGFSILEILAGTGNHQEFVMAPDGTTLSGYYHLDVRPPVLPEGDTRVFLTGDATTYKADPKFGINLAIGFFFTGSTITDNLGAHSREILVQLFRNMKANLTPGGGFLINFTPNGYEVAMKSFEAVDSHYRVNVPTDSAIRTKFGIEPAEVCIASYFRRTEYNRLTATCSDSFPKGFEIWASGVCRGRVTIENPLTQRYFTEPEFIDCAKEAGFDEFMFFRFIHPDKQQTQLKSNFVLDSGLDDEEFYGLMSTDILCINK